MLQTLEDSHAKLSNALYYRQCNSIAAHPFTTHEHFELLYLRKGNLTVTMDQVTVTLHPGDLVLIVPFVFHRNELATDISADVFSIAAYLCQDIARQFHAKRPVRPYLRSHEISPLARELFSSLPNIIRSKKATTPGASNGQLPIEACDTIQPYLSVLLLEVIRKLTLVPLEARNISVMQKILKYCTANFSQEITRDAVSTGCGVSPAMISQTFASLGTSFRDYINTLRINRAYQLLTTTNKPITEIIYECGYSNQGTFNRNFQLQFGKSPRDVRRKH